ncbi:FYVE zinc finger-domain-containing protein [Xylaria venustula]|nr:FYVE zinc finger-domain-containing protein [Xylaria venustula]
MSDSGENSGQEGSSQGTGSLSRDPSEAGDHNGTSPGPGGANNDQNGVNGDQSALPSVEPDVESEAEPEQPSANIASPYQPLNGVGLNSDNTDTEGTETDAKGSAPHFPLPATRHENTPDINSARQPQHDGNGTTPNGGYHNGVGQSDASGQASSRASSVPSSVPYSLPEQANPGSQTGHVASAEGYTNGGTVEPEEATSSSWGTPNTGSLSPSSPRSPVSHRSDRSPSPGSPGPPGPQQPPGQGGSSGGTQNNGNGDSSPPNQSSDANSGSSPGTGNQGQTSAGGNDSGPSQTTNSSCVAFNETSHRSVGTPAPAVGVSQGSSSHTLPHHPTHLDPTFPANTLLGQVPSTTRRSRVSTSMNPIAPEFVPSGQPATRQEFTVPRWQPDSEVRNCPICDVQFGMFLRKHHCRKCGRVVCDRCSPHRITIPHAYIVRPPGDMGPAPQHPYPGIEGGIADFNTIGGGQRVRLCNPCVPDPNTTPPQAQPSPRPIIVDAQPTRTRFPSNSLGRPHRRHASQGHNPVRTRSVTTCWARSTILSLHPLSARARAISPTWTRLSTSAKSSPTSTHAPRAFQ